jgi:hypothetical protein
VLVVLAGAIALVMVGALARTFMRRGGQVRVAAAPSVSSTDTLVAAIADLDARRERGDPTLDADAYAADRAALKTKLAQALAAEERLV